MDLILWRHAEAQERREGLDDLTRSLTPRGEKDAARVGAWLDRQLPDTARILCSPARRCEQTALALGRRHKLLPELAPDLPAQGLLDAARWPQARGATLVVGHQPMLGQVISQLLGLTEPECPVRKGAAWWLRAREREGALQVVVVAVMPPELA